MATEKDWGVKEGRKRSHKERKGRERKGERERASGKRERGRGGAGLREKQHPEIQASINGAEHAFIVAANSEW